ncbi:MAG: hydantoinase B/oxoprolinase family protein [Pirellulaceae bacterium]|nr:hydantoinase B/oxoprolinase family protein [Pirellulaceae bacterium]
MKDPTRWQFWIDVGGTFTDCLARQENGPLLRRKVLSSGVMLGAVDSRSTALRIIDPTKQTDPDDFWKGYELRLFQSHGVCVGQSVIKSFDSLTGTLHLENRLNIDSRQSYTYELSAGEEAPILGIRLLLGVKLSESLPNISVRLGTTRGTNALLTRSGAETAFITTAGFGDALHIGYQNRPNLFELAIKKPVPLFSDVLEVQERVTANGEILTKLSPDALRASLTQLRATGIRSLAVCLLNAYRHPEHELLVGQIAGEVGFSEVSLSHAVAPLIKIVARGDTTVLNAYLNPILRQYVDKIRQSLGEQSDLRLLTSSGGLVTAERFVGKDSILSGPAGGVVGFSRVAQAAGFSKSIGFDMGGTSTDVSRFDGRYELQYETEKAGVRVVAPMLSIETVAAGGGSICRFDGIKLIVGPESAGADPGPACYGRGGPLTITDINFYLGKILPSRFPLPLDSKAVTLRLEEISASITATTQQSINLTELAEGFLQIANANMSKAIRSISIAKGYDPRNYALVSFGGAAAQHACAVANELGIQQILNHPDAGLLSAYGIGQADVIRHRVAGVYRAFSQETLNSLEQTFAALTTDATSEVLAEGIPDEKIRVSRSLDLRYQGTDVPLTITEPADRNYGAAFADEHRLLYGYTHDERGLEIVALRVEIVGQSDDNLPPSKRQVRVVASPESHHDVTFSGALITSPVFPRDTLTPGCYIEGPAIITEETSTTIIDPDWTAEVLSQGELLLLRKPASVNSRRPPIQGSFNNTSSQEPLLSDRPTADPIMLEIFNNHFAAIAEQMGITLRNTASSVNVKERLDFSCAVFTSEGDLVANAPHIPVHLGAMSQTVKCILEDNPTMKPGDVFVTNDPYRGGSHLPDITVITPIHDSNTSRLLFFTASRAHHAEIGGVTPGSMPPFSKTLGEEGVLIRNHKLVDKGIIQLENIRQLLTSGRFPSRTPQDNLSDLEAQIAANAQGGRELQRLVRAYSLETVDLYMRQIQTAAEHKLRTALQTLADGKYPFIDYLDDGSPIAVNISIFGDEVKIDFTGTGPVHSGNLNANRAIVTAAVMYVMRCLVDDDMPLNQGLLNPVELIIPHSLLNPPESKDPEQSAAVAGGNVETSQRVVDVLLGALGLAAASQGTMNNVLFGDESFSYYETICGGAGATPQAAGTDAIQTHMTNTRLTDPEVMEQRFPVRVREFKIRRGSGGPGKFRGGNGVIRSIEFLKKLDVSIVSQRRQAHAPYGILGGSAGKQGANLIVRKNGTIDNLAGCSSFSANQGDTLVIKTPGGGGAGDPLSHDS